MHQHHHGGGHHAHVHTTNEKSIALAACLTGGFMLAEVAGGIISGSLALLADAGHMLTDFASLSLAWLGFRLARRPADWRRTYGFDRFSVLVAFVNGIALFAIAAWIVVEAIHRLREPAVVLGGVMLWIAIAGLAVNLLAFWVLSHGDRENLNLRAASLHVIGDLLGSVAAVAASIVILVTGWMPIDPLLSIVVALIILRSAWHVVGDAGHILLEGAPPGLDVERVKQELCSAVDCVLDIHHVHAWSISQERPMVTLHADIEPGTDSSDALREIKQALAERFEITHATIEIEYGACMDEAHHHHHQHGAAC
ncbi:MAG TPA: cation diffusion facilitator family transporter [Gammaproteobacteria bacterium]|jgi:cobalt-zinc-cadmium efflux system protein